MSSLPHFLLKCHPTPTDGYHSTYLARLISVPFVHRKLFTHSFGHTLKPDGTNLSSHTIACRALDVWGTRQERTRKPSSRSSSKTSLRASLGQSCAAASRSHSFSWPVVMAAVSSFGCSLPWPLLTRHCPCPGLCWNFLHWPSSVATADMPPMHACKHG
jgi:hypothetical protein